MMRWYNKEGDNSSKWYYDDTPCQLISLGVKKGAKTPCVMRIRLDNSSVINIVVDKDGNFPRISYEAIEPLILIGP
jgi:hypothetical protein